MLSVFMEPVNPQRECPLFSKIPREIRDSIFDFVMTPLEEEYDGYRRASNYRGPKILSTNDRNLSTTVLRCCQAIYLETWNLPAKKSIQHYRIPINNDNQSEYYFPTGMQNLHLHFIAGQSRSRLESLHKWHDSLRIVASNAPDLMCLKIIADYEWFGAFIPVMEYPKKNLEDMEESDCSHDMWWGQQFQAFSCLAVMKLQLETVENRKNKLDIIFEKAAGWRFPLSGGKKLVFKSQKSKWEWWHEPHSREFDFF